MSGKRRYVPKGLTWIEQLFNKKILSEPDGVLVRKVSSVERQASEGLLIAQAARIGFVVTRLGTHYLIHRDIISPKRLRLPVSL